MSYNIPPRRFDEFQSSSSFEEGDKIVGWSSRYPGKNIQWSFAAMSEAFGNHIQLIDYGNLTSSTLGLQILNVASPNITDLDQVIITPNVTNSASTKYIGNIISVTPGVGFEIKLDSPISADTSTSFVYWVVRLV